jgi:three-Cys-motif partner protein
MPSVDPRPEYWQEYTNLQKVKHDLIKTYLGGWFPKLGLWAGRIVYFDTHAGRGRHASGQYGSPLVALDALLNHSSRGRILAKSKVVFNFIERDGDNLQRLEEEIAQRGSLPPGITCQPVLADCFSLLDELVQWFKQPGRRPAPAFFFIDPYGFKVPGKLLRELMSFERVELFINVIWRELDMAMSQPDKMASTLDEVFDGDRWRAWARAADSDERAHRTIEGLKELTGARWATYIRMLGENGVTRYLLVHFTNHDAGRDLIKNYIWKACPDGGFYARKSDDPKQEYLIKPEPDLSPLRAWVLARLPRRWKALEQELRETLWRVPHLNGVIRELHKAGTVGGRDYTGRFLPSANPELFIARTDSSGRD